MMEFSPQARDKLTEPWEEFVPYVYDDKRKKERINGKLQYPEWDGGAVRGTLTFAFGHTDAAGSPKIVKGMRCTLEEAGEILTKDLAPCVRRVNSLLKVPVTQHQFDAVVDGEFNCPSMTPKLCALINAGHPEKVPAKMLQYTYSKGEHMAGLTHRRAAEIQWFNTPDELAPPPAPAEVPDCPKGERNPPPKSIGASKSAAASGSILAGGLATLVKALNDAASPIIEAKQNLSDLGIMEALAKLAHLPNAGAVIGCAIIAFAAFLIADRWMKLRNDHV